MIVLLPSITVVRLDLVNSSVKDARKLENIFFQICKWMRKNKLQKGVPKQLFKTTTVEYNIQVCMNKGYTPKWIYCCWKCVITQYSVAVWELRDMKGHGFDP